MCLDLYLYMSGVFRRQLSVCPRDGGSIMAQRGWEEVVEETLLSAEGFWHLLCSKGKGQGVCHESRMRRQYFSVVVVVVVGLAK